MRKSLFLLLPLLTMYVEHRVCGAAVHPEKCMVDAGTAIKYG